MFGNKAKNLPAVERCSLQHLEKPRVLLAQGKLLTFVKAQK